ncbi:alpha/beta hydrolase [Candidatus Solirubrobacter pratensis]|uniref:alpha/beta hydrolase n=1 Tax=Candidatus Solirubrobacter pratensis TaxID=1298857 RepID=UPI000488565F|nr:alpha/beta hydrolase [Candidatus Solirubrobacter pratensis]
MLRAVLLVITALLAAPAASKAAACPQGARCAKLSVPLDHSGGAPGALPLAYAVMPATGTSVGTIVFLSGGPGQSAIPLTRDLTGLLDPLHLDHDIVFVDQRGTGDSGATKCKAIDTPARVAACAAKLGDKRPFLNTTETALDLEDLRVALGVDKLTLLAVSYGTKVAGEYARRFPQHTAGLILDSPVPVGQLDGTFELRQLGMPRLLRDACATNPCRRSIPDPAAALRAAVLRVQRAPVSGPAVSRTGRVRSEKVGEDSLYGALLAGDASPLVRVFLPAAVASLAKGDAAPLLHLTSLLASGSEQDESDGINAARLLATTCIESHLPWAPDSPLPGRTDAWQAYLAANATPFAPFRPQTVAPFSAASLCAAWPPTPAPQGVPAPGPDVPALVISGRADLRTPSEDARRIAAEYPHARFLSVPGAGHSVITTDTSGCALKAVVAFVNGRGVSKCKGGALDVGAVEYLPATPGALARTRLPGRAGRTLTGVRLTIENVALDSLVGGTLLADAKSTVRLPGLRGGHTTIKGGRITLRRVEWFRGLRISGFIDDNGERGRLIVGGPAASGGTLVLKGDAIAGSLGGHPVRASDFK